MSQIKIHFNCRDVGVGFEPFGFEVNLDADDQRVMALLEHLKYLIEKHQVEHKGR